MGLLHLNIVTFGSKSELRSVGMMSARAGLAVSGVIAIGMFRRACYYVTVRHRLYISHKKMSEIC
jgi:hypothetical protein